EGQHDRYGVEQARAALRTAYGMIEQGMETKTWAMGDDFSMADCAAAPALFYANMAVPFGDDHRRAAAYPARLEGRPSDGRPARLEERPSYARALREAAPYLAQVPR